LGLDNIDLSYMISQKKKYFSLIL